MAQRNFLKQLPVINQTQTLQKFFDATINQVFQPGELQNMNAYIGRKPSYYNPTTDFYKPEYDAERSFYQLEPSMVSKDANGNTQDFLYYTDLVNNLRYQGALVNNHARLFETDYYSWCPPINIDKLENYHNYYWLPDGPPVMTMTIPTTSYTGDGSTTEFKAPTSLPNSIVDVVVKINGVPTTDFTYANGEVTFTSAPKAGDKITIWTNGNFRQNIDGQQTYQYPASVTAYAIEEVTKSFTEEEEIPWASDYAPMEDVNVQEGKPTTTTSKWALNDYLTWEVDTVLNTDTETYYHPTVTLDPAPALVRGMRVEVVDDSWDSNWDVMSWGNDPWENQMADIVELEEINDVMVIDLVNQSGKMIRRADPQYWTVERAALNDNPWSLTNHWYHSSLIFYSGDNYAPSKAVRPILEFDNRLKLYNYGARRLAAVDYIYDANASAVALFNATTEGKTSTIVGATYDQTQLNGKTLEPGQRILALNVADSSVNNKIYVVGVDSNNKITLTADVAPVKYDMVAAIDAEMSQIQNASIQFWDMFSYDQSVWDYVIPQEYWFDGVTWQIAQSYNDGAPLFDLFDSNGISLNDSAMYPNSTFSGSKIFAYEQDSTQSSTLDPVLDIYPVFNTYGSFEFTNNINTDTFTYASGTYSGLKYFANVSLDTNGNAVFDYETSWRYAGQTSQTVDATTGFYNIPQNLQANPDNDDITVLSRNDWFPQFQEILAANNWLYPSKYRTVNVGTNIVQNRGNLLKIMLMAANGNLDLSKTFLYVEREYARSRARLVQYLTSLYNSNAITTVADTLLHALNYLKVTKTSSFAFFNNNFGGDNFYIPASGAYLGLTPLWTPEFILQTTGSNTYLFLRGHDGSLLAGFTSVASTNVQFSGTTTLVVDGVAQDIDIRDQIMLAYEQMLYSSCDASLQEQRVPQFDLTKYRPGKFRTTDYSVAEFTQVATPMFERWVARGQKDFRTNKSYDDTNVWTWNFRGLVDQDGAAVPGHWRGIYRYFFDTERPHDHPWEMLGYKTKPTWWDANYSWTDATKRAALIDAITTGNVAQPGTTPVIDATYARSTFSKYVPVDTNGDLLDPFAAGIVTNAGNLDNFSADWVFGDCAPVEFAWWTSEYASFAASEISYLLKPVRFVETGWEPLDNEDIFPSQSNQWVSKAFGRRKHYKEYTVHNEVVNSKAVCIIGLQQWISDYVKSKGQDITSIFGSHVRGLGVQLAHKVGGFTDSTTLQAATESQGVLPSNNTSVVLYNSPSINEVFYSGVIVKWNGSGWAVMGYDVLDPVFNVLPVNTTGPKVSIALGSMPAPVNAWRPNTHYTTGVLVSWDNGVYQCAKTHTSGSTFESQYWTLQAGYSTAIPPALVYYTKAQVNAAPQTVPYGTVFYKAQDVANFLAGYELYLKSQGWVFDQYNTTINDAKDFRLATRQFLNWIQVNWAPGNFLTLSPLSDGVKFSTDHGTIQPVEQVINGVYSILDRGGNYVDIQKTNVNRINGQITVSAKDSGIFGLRLCVSEIEHCLIFDNTTLFDDVIYDPLFNLRQSRIRMNFNISTNWTGTLNAPGFLITDNLMIPSFDRSVEDVRNMFGIEQPVYSVMRNYARHQIGYQSQSYLADIFTNELNQFEFYQGMIQQKGSASVLDKLLRNTTLTQTTNLEFLEEWAFRVGSYGAVLQENVFEFEITADDVKQEPQRIDFDIAENGLTASQLTALQDPDSLLLTLFQNNTANDSRWVIPPKSNKTFPELPDYTRHASDLPTAGYARSDEADVMANSLISLNKRVQAGTVKLEAGNRVWVYDNGNDSWDMLRSIQDGTTANTVVSVQGGSTGLEVTLFNTTNIQAGEYIYLASPVGTTPDIAGVYKVLSVESDGVTVVIDTAVTATVTYSPSTDVATGDTIPSPDAPAILRLFSIRFYEANGDALASILGAAVADASRTGGEFTPVYTHTALPATMPASLTSYASLLNDGEVVYVDAGYISATQHNYPATLKRWAAYQWNKSLNAFVMFRSQAPRIHRNRIDSARIYDTVTSIDSTSNQIQANPLLYPDVMSYDPVQGLVPGAAMREVWYKQEYDPARYNQGSATPDLGLEWDETQVGRIWWNLRTTRFMLSETNDLNGLNTDDYETEMKYRLTNWGSVATDCEVDFYEWTESDVPPATWSTNFTTGSNPSLYDGDVYNSADPSWVEKQVYDNAQGTWVTKYYFWVKNRQTTPAVNFRKISAASAAQIIADPASNGISWLAPIAANSMIVKSISQYLTPTSTIQLRVRKNDAEVGKHSQWNLLRPGDALSLPSDDLFTSMTTSLVGQDPLGNPIPDPTLYITAQTGDSLRDGQSWYTNMSGARKHLVQYLNNLFATILIADERPYAMDSLLKTESASQYMQWSQTIGSAYIEPVPSNSQWSGKYSSVSEFKKAVLSGKGSSPALVMNFGISSPFWAVMSCDTSGNVTFTTRWDQEVSSLTELNSLVVAEGTKVLVNANAATANLWTVWEFKNGAFSLLASQRYRTSDAITIVDWYAAGYDATMVPSSVYASQAARDVALGADPTIQYIKVNDDGQGRWMWQKWSDGVWHVVAKENGTFKLNDNLWSNTGTVLNVTGSLPSDFAAQVANRDMGLELNVIMHALRDSVLLAAEQNELFFSMVKYVHTEQDFVDWCFKTSFMYVQGFNANLIASPIASIDYTSDLLSYINEVKPYHVKIRDFISKYGINDTATVHATDFDKPVYFDPVLKTYRVLDPNVAADVVVLKTGNYADWYNNWLAGNNQVRKIKATLTFDRVTDTVGGQNDDGALNRLSRYWSGDVTSKPALSAVMRGIYYSGTIVEGGYFTAPEFDLNSFTWATDANGNLIASNAPSYVYFAQKYDANTHKLSSDWDTPTTLWDDADGEKDSQIAIWDQLNMVSWEQFVSRDWEQLTYTGSLPGVWDAYEYDFVASSAQFDASAGNRLEVFKNGERLSLYNKDFIVVQDSTESNKWKVYISTDTLKSTDTLVILLVAADAPIGVLNGGAMTNVAADFNSVMNGGTLAQPYYAADHPEELVDVSVVAGVRIRISQRWLPGSAQMDLLTINQNVSNTVEMPIPAQTSQAIAMYVDGKRIPMAQVSYDARDSEVTYTGSTISSNIQAVVWGYGGVNQITGASYFNGDGSTVSFTMNYAATLATDLFVTINGVMTTAFTVNGTTLKFKTAPAAGAFIKVMNMPSVNNASAFNVVNVAELDIVELDTRAINSALNITGSLDPVTSIVEVDGLRVMSTGIYEAFITPENNTLEMGWDVPLSDLTATFNGKPITIATDVAMSLTIPAATRTVDLGANWAASDLVVTEQGASAPLVVGEITGTAPGYSLGNLNPAAPELNATFIEGWDNDSWDNIVTWDDIDTIYEKYVVTPANATLVVFQGRLISLNPLAADLHVSVEFGDTIPNDLTGFTWTPANADALLMGNELMMLGGVTGDLVVFDASQSQFDYNKSALSQFPGAKTMTVTTFTNVNAMGIRTVTYDHITGDNWFPIPGTYPNVPSLWVTLNGKKLRYGIDFYVNAADNGYDIPAWDEDARDEYSEFGPGSMAVRMNEESGVFAKPGDHVVITVFGATEATAPQEQIMFLDPLREHGFADRISDISTDDMYTLISPLEVTDEKVVIQQVLSDGTPTLNLFKTDRSPYNPGLMWIGKELVHFLSASVDTVTNTITLHNVIRGYRGSSIQTHSAGEPVWSVSSSKVNGNAVQPNNDGDILKPQVA